MNILIINTVALNGGDYLILESLLSTLKEAYGEEISIGVYDLHNEVAKKYYPHIQFRKSLSSKYDVDQWDILMKCADLYIAEQEGQALALLPPMMKEDFTDFCNADLVVSTGGTYLVENYYLGSRIIEFAFILNLNKPLVFFTQSLGPFNQILHRKYFSDIMDDADLIILRDQESLRNIASLGIDTSNVKICSDAVFSQSSISVLTEAKDKVLNNTLQIGISVRYWRYYKKSPAKVAQERYFRSIASLCKFIVQHLDGNVVFVSTCQGIPEYHTDDSKAAIEISNLLPQEIKDRLTIIKDFLYPDDFNDIVSGFDLFVSTRMHGAIQSLNLGVPVLPIAYEFKTRELFNKLIDSGMILDIETINENNIIEVFSEFYANIDKFRADLFDKVIAERQSSLNAIGHLRELVI